jgi:hypothetical protein
MAVSGEMPQIDIDELLKRQLTIFESLRCGNEASWVWIVHFGGIERERPSAKTRTINSEISVSRVALDRGCTTVNNLTSKKCCYLCLCQTQPHLQVEAMHYKDAFSSTVSFFEVSSNVRLILYCSTAARYCQGQAMVAGMGGSRVCLYHSQILVSCPCYKS